jgi:2-methylcitrate dehydratase PrpD
MAGNQRMLAEFVSSMRLGEVPTLALDRARDGIVDCIGVAIAGTGEECVRSARAALEALGGKAERGTSVLIGSPSAAGPLASALHNGIAAHALDYDDITHPGNAHMSSCVVPALLAVLPDAHPLSDRFLEAYVTGYELGASLGQAIPRRFRHGRWHPTGVFGPIAAAAAVAKALELSPDQVMNALGTVASTAAGLAVNLGSMTKPLHAGRSAESGVLAASLAKAGFTSSGNAYDDDGYLVTFARTEALDEVQAGAAEAFAQLGRSWHLCSDNGIAIKAYPSCGGTHPAIEAALRLRDLIGDEEIVDVRLGTSSAAPGLLVHHRPSRGLQGKFSMEFTVAAAILDGEVKIATFSDSVATDPRMVALIEKMRPEIDPRVIDSTEHAVIITVRTTANIYEERVDLARGKPDRWLSETVIRAKFADCAERMLPAPDADRLYKLLRTGSDTQMEEVRTLLSGGIAPDGAQPEPPVPAAR